MTIVDLSRVSSSVSITKANPCPPILQMRTLIQLSMVAFLQATCLAATFEVTTTADSGPGSLRQVLADANNNGAGDTITFSNGSNGSVNFHDDEAETITLGGTELLAYTNMTIVGPGAGKLSISGNQLSRVFQMGGDRPTIVISGITVKNGRASTLLTRTVVEVFCYSEGLSPLWIA